MHVFDACGRYVRSVVMLSACREVEGLLGKRYGPPPFRTHREARAELLSRRKAIQHFRYGEPSWHLQQSAMDAIGVLAPPNAPNLLSALGGSISSRVTGTMPSPLADLTPIRNFVAHKGPYAGSKCSLVLQAAGCRSVLEWLDQPVAGIPRFHELVANLRVLSEVAAS